MVKTYCLKCKKEVEDSNKVHECGGHKFVRGDIGFKGKNVICKCGGLSFTLSYRADARAYFVDAMSCTECNSIVEVKTLRDKTSSKFWV